MKVYFLILIFKLVFGQEDFKLFGLFFGCDRDVTLEYHKSLQDFSTRLFKEVASKENYHFVISQYSLWLSLAGLAEGSNEESQKKLFHALNLPQNTCLREKYYEIATGIETSAEDVTLLRKRILLLDENLKSNETWIRNVRASGLVDTKTAPLLVPESTNQMRELINASLPNFKFNGNSILLDSFDYEGLWTSAFENATIKDSDFYDDTGIKIGTVTMMKVSQRVKLAYIPILNAKLLEMRVGNNGRYRMLFILNLGKNDIKRTIQHFPSSFIIDSMPLQVESIVPLEISIPKFSITSELDLKASLVNVGLGDIWNNDGVGRYISQPSTVPGKIIQRVTVKLNRKGIEESTSSGSGIITGLASVVGRDFVANRPFVFGLVDSLTRTWLFAGAFSDPGKVDT